MSSGARSSGAPPGRARMSRSSTWSAPPRGPLTGRPATNANQRTICLITRAGDVAANLVGHGNLVRDISWHPSGAYLASAGETTVRIWDAASGRMTHVLEGHAGTVSGCTFSADGRLLASSCEDGAVRFWDTGSWALVG